MHVLTASAGPVAGMLASCRRHLHLFYFIFLRDVVAYVPGMGEGLKTHLDASSCGTVGCRVQHECLRKASQDCPCCGVVWCGGNYAEAAWQGLAHVAVHALA